MKKPSRNTRSFTPDLVLLDVMMPGIKGFKACRQLKDKYGEDCAPIIFITAKNESDDVVEGFSAGGIDYLPKPFQSGEVVVRVRTHLHSRLLAEQQKALVDQLSKADAAKNRFLGIAAHDLRNPLAGIRGLSEFLLDKSFGSLTTDQEDLVDNILTASQSMLQLVNELLDMATIESGELKIDRKETDLIKLIEKSFFFAKMTADKKGPKIDFHTPIEKTNLLIDLDKIKQVVDNLLSNAIKYSPPNLSSVSSLPRQPAHPPFRLRIRGQAYPKVSAISYSKTSVVIRCNLPAARKALGWDSRFAAKLSKFTERLFPPKTFLI